MTHLRTGLLFAAMSGVVTSALAGAGIVTTTVARMQPNVTYSTAGTKPLTAYIGYTVTVGSDPSNTNTINNVVFTGTASATDTAEKPVFYSSDGATCTATNADGTSISCALGQLRAGQTYPTFAVFFKAPVKVVNDIADGPGSDFAKFSGTTFYAEGTGGLENSVPPNSTIAWTAADVELGTSNPTTVKSSVPKSGGQFFTGSGSTTADDPFATSVTIPAATFYTPDSSIVESTFVTSVIGTDPPTNLQCTNFTTCWSSDVKVPGSFGYLTIVLRQDASTINPGVKIGNVQIYYEGTAEEGDNFKGVLGACPSPTTPLIDRPCIASSKYYKNRSVAGWTPDLDGDFEWTIITLKNGTLKIQ